MKMKITGETLRQGLNYTYGVKITDETLRRGLNYTYGLVNAQIYAMERDPDYINVHCSSTYQAYKASIQFLKEVLDER